MYKMSHVHAIRTIVQNERLLAGSIRDSARRANILGEYRRHISSLEGGNWLRRNMTEFVQNRLTGKFGPALMQLHTMGVVLGPKLIGIAQKQFVKLVRNLIQLMMYCYQYDGNIVMASQEYKNYKRWMKVNPWNIDKRRAQIQGMIGTTCDQNKLLNTFWVSLMLQVRKFIQSYMFIILCPGLRGIL